MEYKVNNSGASVRDRPPPHVDLWELFAGSCNLSRLAPHYDLNTLQPLDILFGQDFKNGSMRKKIKVQVDQFKPWLIVMGVDCRFWNLFNINMNWSHRQELLESLQDEERILVQFAVDIALMQYKAGRYFLLENPLRSRLWEEDNVRQLRDLEGIWSTVLDAGAYGAEINNEPIAKPMRWMGNLPGFDQTLNLRLTPTQRLYCKPIQGSMTRRSQQYPDELCHCILQELKSLVFQREPHRFGAPLHQVYAMAYPTEDLALWDHIVDYITNVYERGAKRPFNIGLDTEMGKTIQQLFRIKAVRLQACYAPTARRIPPNVDEYYTRAALLQYADGTRAVEIEDLGEIEFPKMKFSKAVRVAVFGYGHRLETPDPKQNELKEDRPVIPGMSADISFPNVSDVEQHIRRSVARLHLNLGHPTAPELLRLLAHQGKVPGPVIKAVQGLVCSTCERLRPPQEPRPASMPSLTAGQFADEVQADIFYARLLDGTSFAVLGIVDKATGFHQAGYMPDRNATTAFQVLSDIWLRPFGLPLRFVCDPDHTFRGQFEQRLMAMGVMVEHCPPEAHYIIGMVERRNAILRLTLEKVIDQLGVVSLDQVPTVLIQACHSINSLPFTRGRSGYQAVFGRTPRLPDDVLTDTQVLSTSTQPFRDVDNPGLRAELVRSEAMKALIDLNAQQQFRRALLRKTRNVKVPELLPGQRCAVWRWTKKGVRKRGAWLTARFLSWDPQYPGRQAWVRLGASTTLVTSEQLRAAHGFEDWCPDEQDLKALKDASKDFGPQMLEDERGEPPPESDPPQDQESLQNIAEQQAAAALLPVPEDHELDMHLEEYTPSIPDVPDATEQFEQDEQATATEPAAAAEQAAATAEQTAAAADTGQTTEHTEPGPMQEEDPLPVLPLKRPFDTLFIMEENGTLARAEHHWGGTPPMAYGTTSKAFFKVYAMTKQRQQDINNTDKAAAESDTTVDSDSGDSSTEQAERPKYHNPGMSRQERKQLDREIPWRHILTMPPAYIDKFLAAIDKETNSWSEWRSVKPLSREEAQAVLRDKILSKRVLRSRACYRDKNVGQGEVKAKCRIVCLGHQDPDLEVLNRSSPTPGRTSEMVMYAMIVAGMNQELFDTQKPWLAWAGDAQTAFLQGKQKDSERPLPLYMRPPKDGLIEKTGHWRSDLYQILGNVYGLSNAPHLWSEEDIPFTKDSLVLGYSDASWCNASRSGSQIGLVIGITSMEAKQKPVKFTPLDWRSSRAPRVCRSTLAAEACAADEAADRGAYLNRIISELIYAQPSHRVGCRMSYAQATDARSLYDAIMAEAPNISDKRSLVSVRSVQEVVDTHQLHWVPTTLQFADGLTKADVNLRNVCRAWFEDPRAVLADHPENQKLLEQLGGHDEKNPYVCGMFDLSQMLPSDLSIDSKHHVAMFSPVLDPNSVQYVHHMILYACDDGVFQHLQVIPECESMPPGCNQMKWPWAVGSEPIVFPAEAGMPMGEGKKWFALQMHYYNPSLDTGVMDSSGVRVTFANTLRTHDAATFRFNGGTGDNQRDPIPAGQSEYTLSPKAGALRPSFS
ncbi:Tyramine beta-hydroxylase [Durusdinium trenchii]|uniref:Tyramine beta-hydroxylase n=2 Tax=Durusdinium trenchii TaxID=1381693 RepID=A0ABP0KLB1_9DINO